jgi:hypothetical protein
VIGPSASQSRDFSLPVYFNEMHRFRGPRRANKAWACNVYFSGRRDTVTINPYFSHATEAVPFQAEPISLCRDSVACIGFTTTYKTAGTVKIPLSRTRHRDLWVGLWVGNSAPWL